MRGVSDMLGFPLQSLAVPRGRGLMPAFDFTVQSGNNSNTLPFCKFYGLNLNRDRCYRFRLNVFNPATDAQIRIGFNNDYGGGSGNYYRHLGEASSSFTVTRTANVPGFLIQGGFGSILDVQCWPLPNGAVGYSYTGLSNGGAGNTNSAVSWGVWSPSAKQNVTEIAFTASVTGAIRRGSTVVGNAGW